MSLYLGNSEKLKVNLNNVIYSFKSFSENPITKISNKIKEGIETPKPRELSQIPMEIKDPNQWHIDSAPSLPEVKNESRSLAGKILDKSDKYKDLTNELHSYIQNNLDNIHNLEKVYERNPDKIYTEPILYIPYDKFAEYIVLLEYLMEYKNEWYIIKV